MQLTLTDDQTLLVETTRRFLDDRLSAADARALRDHPSGCDHAYWASGAELGWTSLLVAEADGGGSVSGHGLRDLALVAHEFGRHAAPGPLAEVNVVAGAISRSGSAEQKAAVLPGTLDGSHLATWAHMEPWSRYQDGITARLSPRANGYVLTGVKAPVAQAADADSFLVSALLDGEPTQVLVPSDTQGLHVDPMTSLDLTRRFGTVRFDDCFVPSSAVVGSPRGAAPDIQRQLLQALAVQLAESVGAMERALEVTLQWTFDRYSFGRPISSYQVIKHRMADMHTWLEASHGLADAAAASVSTGDVDAEELVSAGKSYIGDHGTELCQDCVQLHGGIGLTFEHDLHLFLRRVTLNSALLGTPRDHRINLSRLVELGAVS